MLRRDRDGMDVALPLAQTQHEVTFGFAVSPHPPSFSSVFFLVDLVLAVAVAVALAVEAVMLMASGMVWE